MTKYVNVEGAEVYPSEDGFIEEDYYIIPVSDVVKAQRIRWCDTHDSQHMLKDACMRRMASFGMGAPDGAVNIGEQMDGLKDCVEGWRQVLKENSDE